MTAQTISQFQPLKRPLSFYSPGVHASLVASYAQRAASRSHRRPHHVPDGRPRSMARRTPRNAENRGFFTLPFEYWATGTIDELKLPSKAMLLIILKETQDLNAKRKTFLMAFARAKEWHGISKRTAERGIHQLRKAGLLQEKLQLVQDARHP